MSIAETNRGGRWELNRQRIDLSFRDRGALFVCARPFSMAKREKNKNMAKYGGKDLSMAPYGKIREDFA